MSDYAVMPLSDYEDVCNVVREKTDETEVIKSGEMADKVSAVYQAGEGTMLDTIWEILQIGGKRNYYEYFFYYWGNADETFFPKYDITVANTTVSGSYASIGAFRYFNYSTGTGFDLAQRLEDCGVSLDTSAVKNFTFFFYDSYISHIPTIDMTNATNTYMAFSYLRHTHTIDKLILNSEGTTTFNDNTFNGSSKLKNIKIEGVIGSNISLPSSPLTADSIKSITNALSDTTTDKTVTFKLSAVNTAFETAEGLADGSESQEWLNLIATKENWTFSLV